MEVQPNYIALGIFGVGSLLSYLNGRWQNQEIKKVDLLLKQRKWKVDELYQDALQKYNDMSGSASEMDSMKLLYKKQFISGYLNSQTPISVDGIHNNTLLIVEATDHESIAKMSKVRKRYDGNASLIKNIFSRKRDNLYKNNIKVITSGNYVITNDTTSPQSTQDSSPTNSLDFMYYIPLKTTKLQDNILRFSWLGNLDSSSIQKYTPQQRHIAKSIQPSGGSLNFDKHIVPSVLPLLTTMQFPFYSATGIYLAKNTFKIGIKTNLPVWLFCDVNFSTLNGSLSFNDKTLKLFFSWKGLKEYLYSKANSNAFWKWFFGIVAVGGLIWASVEYLDKKNNGNRNGRNLNNQDVGRADAGAQPAAN